MPKSSLFPVTLLQKIVDCVHPCPCGYFGDAQKPCTCSPSMVTKYQKRISGPMLDRIDIHISVPRVDYEKLSDRRTGESSRAVRQRPAEVRKFCELDAACTSLMKTAMSQLQPSAGTYHRVLKLARTIADLAEALQHRPRMQK